MADLLARLREERGKHQSRTAATGERCTWCGTVWLCFTARALDCAIAGAEEVDFQAHYTDAEGVFAKVVLAKMARAFGGDNGEK